MPFKPYLAELQKDLKGRATERTYYPALKTLLEAPDPGVEVFIEAGHVTAVGNLDFERRSACRLGGQASSERVLTAVVRRSRLSYRKIGRAHV